jgi:Tfp pilus assembly protein PilX
MYSFGRPIAVTVADRRQAREAAMLARLWGCLTDERGVALPTAMIMLIVLTAMTLAFASLGTTEPVIARNHSMGAQARAFAESGVERAIWVMTNATPTFTSGTAATPYNGTELLTVSTNGGFTVQITDGSNSYEKNVVAVGWAPDNTGQLRAARKIQATISTTRLSTFSPPCALCVKGTLEVGGNSTIDARGNHCSGSTPTGGTMSTGATTAVGSAAIYGPGNDVANEIGTPSPDMPALQDTTNFASVTLTSDEIATLRAQAQASGTYLQGAQTFNTGDPMANGLIFVDTTTGADYTSTTPDAEAGSVAISGNFTWSGWLVVMGSISISGTVNLTGTLYAMNDFTFTGNGEVRGAVITENKKDVVSTVVDSSLTGSSAITYDCTAARSGGGQITAKWALSKGTFREIEGQ